jgi:malate synthase
VQSLHKRGAHAIGGMSAFIPDRHNPQITEDAFIKVKNDKIREAEMGFDGSWVAHPDLVGICNDVFSTHLEGKSNQIDYVPIYEVTEDMLQDFNIANASITEQGIRTNIKVGILYIQSWLLGQGAAALFNLMEDAATAEISRSQLWQWVHCNASTDKGLLITEGYIDKLIEEEVTEIQNIVTNTPMLSEAVSLFKELILNTVFEDFLTIPAYKLIK